MKSKNQLFKVFHNFECNSFDFYVETQEKMKEGLWFNTNIYEGLNLFCQLAHDVHARKINKSLIGPDTGLKSLFSFGGSWPLVRDLTKIMAFDDEQWKIILAYRDHEKIYEGGVETLFNNIKEIDHILTKEVYHEAFIAFGGVQKIFFQVTKTGVKRLEYEQGLREKVQDSRIDNVNSCLKYQSEIYDKKGKTKTQLQMDYKCIFQLFNLNPEENLELSLKSMNYEKLADLQASLSVRSYKRSESGFIDQHVNEEWHKQLKDKWKKCLPQP